MNPALKKEIEDVIMSCIYLGKATEDDGFLMIPGRAVTVRKRSPNEKWKPEWIHHFEYIKALKECASAGKTDVEIMAAALAKLGLPNNAEFMDEIEQYVGMN